MDKVYFVTATVQVGETRSQKTFALKTKSDVDNFAKYAMRTGYYINRVTTMPLMNWSDALDESDQELLKIHALA
jgi:hypothetical protein